MAIHDGSFFENKVLKDACAHARATGGAINFAGLLSKGNVHASLEHVQSLIKMAKDEGVEKINLHLFADGKDVPPHTVQGYLAQLPGEDLASLIGRYYAMDRNGSWPLTQTAYQLMTGTGNVGRLIAVADAASVIEETYKQGQTEEYLPAIRFADDKNIKDGDSLFFFNYREDSIQQLASAFILPGFDKFPVAPFKDLFVATMTHYNDAYPTPVAFPADTVETPFGKVVSDQGLTQLRLAETYKYAHVTYFFNGYKEQPFPGEFRTLIPSNSGLHPEEHPEMMATAITDRLVEAIRSRAFDFVLVNYANGDTIAHTADYNAGIEAVKVIDREITRVVGAAEEDPDTLLVITSDHGNIEEMINETTGLPESQHDASPVPLYLVTAALKGRKFVNADSLTLETLGSLADVAPTILALMGIPKPEDMTGRSILDGLV